MKNKFYLVLCLTIWVVACTGSGADKDRKGSENTHFKTETGLQSCISSNSGIQVFTVNAKEPAAIKTADGAQIIIPAGIFVDKNGNLITGNVSIQYQPINTVPEIVASGIPMVAGNNGKVESFVSDGMFKITAQANGENVEIASGKKMDVFTPSRDTKSNFNMWFFDTKAGNWIDLGSRNGVKGKKDIEIAKADAGLETATSYLPMAKLIFSFARYEEKTPQNCENTTVIPKNYNPNKAILDLKFDKKLYPEFAPFSRILWQYAGTDKLLDPENNQWIYASAWKDVKITPREDNATYDLTIVVANKTFKTIIQPVVTGKDADIAKKLAETVKNQANKKEDGANMATLEANMYNAFGVNRLGTYNCDRFYADPAAFTYSSEYIFEHEQLDHDKQIYFLTENKTKVLSFNAKSYSLKFDPKIVDAVFIVAAQGTIAAVSQQQVHDIKNSKGGKLRLMFSKIGQKIGSLSDLSNAINSL